MGTISSTYLISLLIFLVFCNHSQAEKFYYGEKSGDFVCSTNLDCNTGFTFPVFGCESGSCEAQTTFLESRNRAFLVEDGSVGDTCISIRNCALGLVCAPGNPTGKCVQPDGVLGLGQLITNIIQEDSIPGKEGDEFPPARPAPNQPTPLFVSRAISIIFLAAHDALALLTGDFQPTVLSPTAMKSMKDSKKEKMKSSSNESKLLDSETVGASLIAGFTAAKILYPESARRINAVKQTAVGELNPVYVSFAELVGRTVVSRRDDDGSSMPLFDANFAFGEFLRHQPDPNVPVVTNEEMQLALWRTWGSVRPFILTDVRQQAFLGRFPDVESEEYREQFEEVRVKGQCNNLTKDGVPLEDIGIFWGYDGSPLLGAPPRLYLQIILSVRELKFLNFKQQLRALTAVGVSLADTGIATWFWKYFYDLWRPVVGIRNDPINPDKEWDPRGVALTNVLAEGTSESERPTPCVGLNPDFPAYPSGHAAFGTAAFTTIAKVLGKRPKDIDVTFTSDEFNGDAVEGTTGEKRRVFTQSFNLQEGIDQNKASRIFIGAHWPFDATAGEIVGTQVADIISKEFKI